MKTRSDDELVGCDPPVGEQHDDTGSPTPVLVKLTFDALIVVSFVDALPVPCRHGPRVTDVTEGSHKRGNRSVRNRVDLGDRRHIAKAGVKLHQERQRIKIDAEAVGSEQVLQPIVIIINKAAAGLTPAVLGEFKAPEIKVAELEISLQGVKHLRQFNEFMNFLEQDVTGVESVRPTKVKGNVIELTVMFMGDPDGLLDLLTKQDVLSFQMNLNRYSDKGIMIEVR